MTDFTPALTRLRVVVDGSANLQGGLRKRQDELLSLEQSITDVAARRTSALVLIDQAEDVRRAVRGHADLGVSDACEALTQTRGALIGALVERTVTPVVGRELIHVADRALREAESGSNGLEGAATALAATSQASSDQLDLLYIARESVDMAAGFLESARRAVFWVLEDLPVLVESMTTLADTAESPVGNPASVRRGASSLRASTVTERSRAENQPKMWAVQNFVVHTKSALGLAVRKEE
jgi:hypothetical protein